MNKRGGFDINSYVKILKEDDSDLKDSKAVNFVTHHFRTALDYKRNYEHRGTIKKLVQGPLERNGLYLTFSYFFVKFLYFLVAFVQLILLNYWLSDAHHTNKLSVYDFLFGAHNWKLSERFPRMTLCKFDVYILTDVQTHWLQCTLPVNIYIEKIYIIIWGWLWILMGLIAYSFVRQLISLSRARRYLLSEFDQEEESKQDLGSFGDYLKQDGLLVLKLIKSNTNKYYATNILNNLFILNKKHD